MNFKSKAEKWLKDRGYRGWKWDQEEGAYHLNGGLILFEGDGYWVLEQEEPMLYLVFFPEQDDRAPRMIIDDYYKRKVG